MDMEDGQRVFYTPPRTPELAPVESPLDWGCEDPAFERALVEALDAGKCKD